MIRTALVLTVLAMPAAAQVQMAALNPKAARLVDETVRAAGRLFPNLPAVRLTSAIGQTCGQGPASDLARYCTTTNLIYLAADIDQALDAPAAAYLVAHQLAHAAQYRAGLVDQANAAGLGMELELQAECLAGVILARAHPDQRGAPSDWLPANALSMPHSGAEPLENRIAPAVPPASRDEWLDWGRGRGTAADCTVGDLGAKAFGPR